MSHGAGMHGVCFLTAVLRTTVVRAQMTPLSPLHNQALNPSRPLATSIPRSCIGQTAAVSEGICRILPSRANGVGFVSACAV